MAGPQNNFSSSKQTLTIYDSEGNATEATRPNAIDLVRCGGYSWKLQDAGKAQAETDGPVDPAAEIVVIYDEAGNGVEAHKNNAREMVERGTHTWTTNAVTEAEAAAAVIEAAEAVAKAEKAPELKTHETLSEEAVRITGEEDVSVYLKGFSLDALKQIASERYGETIHHRASKETAISKIVELEEARQLED